jgi:hypothetical protein
MRYLSWLLLIFAAPCWSQSWTGILSSSRAINWGSAGLPATITYGSGGSSCNGLLSNCVETTTNPWTPPTRTQCGSTLTPSGGDDTSAINTAFTACKPGTYVLLSGSYASPATFNINSTLYLYTYSGVTLEGGGAGATIIKVNGASGYIGMGSNPGNTCAWTAGFTAGTTSITATGCGSQPTVDYLLSLQQCDSGYYSTGGNGSCATGSSIDDHTLYICAQNTACNRGSIEGVGPPFNAQIQTVLITGVSGTCSSSCTITFSPGLYMPNWNYQASGATNPPSPYITLAQNNTTGLAIQDLTIWTAGTTLSTAYTVDLNFNYASWIKGVRFVGNTNNTGTPLGMSNDKNCLVMNNYFFANVTLTSNFGEAIQEGADSDDLVLNNISASGDQWEGVGQQEGIVVAYNYGRDNFTSGVFNFWFNHDGGDNFVLYEGNEGAGIQEDNTHGNHNLTTAVRNYLSGWDPPYAASSDPNVNTMDAFQRVDNFIGNALGSAQITTYLGNGTGFNYVYQLGYGGGFTDALTSSSAMLWGNCDTVNGGCRFVSSEVPTTATIGGNLSTWANAVPANNNLPCTFFLSSMTGPCSVKYSGGTGLSWWKVCTSWTTFPTACAGTTIQPFPIAGPEIVSGPYVNGYAYDNPAAIAWEYLPIDTTYQNSYAITASSWAGGTETLTISSLPNTTHLMGPFQFSGVAGGCSTGATFGGNSEILMTGSSSTTVTYALASNPGSNACTGTMLFPDVRQFDERVFESDLASATSVTAQGVTFNGVVWQ